MTPEEQNTAIWAEFSNYYYFPQEQEIKQALGKYILVQPRGTVLLHDTSALIDAYSQEVCTADFG